MATEARDPAGNPNALVIAKDKSLAAVDATKPLANDMKEAKDMALHVVERLEATVRQVAASELESAALVGARIGDITQDFGAFLNKFRGEKTVFRLVHNREVMAKIHGFHEDIDKALGGLDVSSDTSVWRKRWEGYREAYCGAFEKISRNRVKLLGDIRGDAQAQSQALAYLLYEYRCMTSKYTENELKVLSRAFTEVSQFSQFSQFSKNKVPTIHTWFLPPYEFECNDNPFTWGAFGTVHHGKYEGANVIVKRVKITSEASRAAFVKEAEVWYRANKSPNVVRLYGAYHLGPEPYFVSEYAANGTLSDFLLNDENHRKTWKLLHDAAKGLRALHRQKILHNDLKCNNILVTSDIVAKLIDFGLSAQLSTLQATSVHKAQGAFGWKASEVLTEERSASFASDVYSLAMCIYEAVTRAPPYAGVADVVLRRHVREGILPKRPDGGDFTDEQWQLIVDMAALNPDDRISMDEVVRRLERFEEDEFNNYSTKFSNTLVDEEGGVCERISIGELSDAEDPDAEDMLGNLLERTSLEDEVKIKCKDIVRMLRRCRDLCNEMNEAQGSSASILNRLEMVFKDLLSATAQHQPDPGVIEDVTKLSTQYLEFLTKYAGHNQILRLVECRVVALHVRRFHEIIDALVLKSSGAQYDWNSEVTTLQNAEFSALRATINSSSAEDLLRNQSVEALSLLRFEKERVGSRSYTPEELAVFDIAEASILTRFMVESEPLKSWFLPPHEIECGDAFAVKAYGSVHRGKFSDSTEIVVKRVKIASEEADRTPFVTTVEAWYRANQIPNVVRLVGAYQFGPEPYLAIEHAANGSLNAFLVPETNRRVTWKLLRDAASGLRELHRLGILHSDLRCNNILVMSDGVAKLTDIGGSIKVSDKRATSELKAARVSNWSAPEVLSSSSTPTTASDVFSFAMCIYEAVTRTEPWESIPDSMVRQYVRVGRLPPRLDGAFTDEQWSLVESMCAFNPADRLSMDDVVEKVRAFEVMESGGIVDPVVSVAEELVAKEKPNGSTADSIRDAKTRLQHLLDESCHQLRENASLCKALILAVLSILDSVDAGSKERVTDDAARALTKAVCARLILFCTGHTYSRTIFSALARNQFVLEELESIRRDTVRVCELLRIKHDQLDMDGVKWNDLLGIRESQLKFQLENTFDLSEVLPDRVAQVEALALVQFELAQEDRLRMKDELLQLARKKFTSFFGEFVEATAPDWFIPPYAVDAAADDEDCDNVCSFGEVRRGLLRQRNDAAVPVVVKTLRMYGLGGALADRSFMRDVAKWHDLSHPNIVALKGACHVSRRAFLVCEPADGGDLLEYLRLPGNALKIWDRFIEAVQGLQYLHANNIVHGNLRCSNIMVSRDGIAQLTDFGLHAVRSAVLANGAASDGYLQWTSPECLALSDAEPTEASDVYSLGMCMLEALEGGPPWGAVDAATLLSEIEGGQLPECPPVEEFRDAWDVVQDMCVRDPAKRLRLDRVMERLERLAEDRYQQRNRDNYKGGAPSISSGAADAPVGSIVAVAVTDTRVRVASGKEVAEYRVEVHLSTGDEFAVWRRYSQFKKFHDKLPKAADLPQFPSKTLFKATSASIMRDRQQKLDTFLGKALYLEDVSFGILWDHKQTYFNCAEATNAVL